MRPPHHPTYRAFTLVELLVVISIIVLLVGLLLPSLSAAKYTARKVVSLNNMHQTSLLIFAYAEDDGTVLPNSVRQDQGCNYWNNFYIINYPTWLVTDTIGYTILPYVSDNRIFMAPNHWNHLTDVYEPVDPGYFQYWYSYWYGAPASSVPFYRMTSYDYLPWLGFLAYPTGPTIRLGDNVPGTAVPFNNLAILEEEVAGDAFVGPNYWDDTPDSPWKSVNIVNGVADGGNVVFGDGSGSYASQSAFLGTDSSRYIVGGYNYANIDIVYRH